MNPNTALFERYVSFPAQSRVMICQHDDAQHILEIAKSTAQVTVYHRDGLVIRQLRQRLAALPNVLLSDAVFPHESETFDVAIIALPKGRDLSRAVMASAWQAVKPGGMLYIAGANQGGAKSALRDFQTIAPANNLGTKARHRIFSAMREAKINAPQGWLSFTQPTPQNIAFHGQTYTVKTQPGIFSHGRLDDGTARLLEAVLEMDLPANLRVLDAGCGNGIVGMVAQRELMPQDVVWVDSDLLAVNCTRSGLDQGATVLCADVTQDPLADVAPFELILCNPPFHKDHAVDRSFMTAFATNANQLMSKNGQLVIVCNRFLPYRDVIASYFRNFWIPRQNSRFTVLAAKHD